MQPGTRTSRTPDLDGGSGADAAGPGTGADAALTDRQRAGDIALIARATVAVLTVTAALARHLGAHAVRSVRAMVGRPRSPAAPATGPLEEILARAVRRLL